LKYDRLPARHSDGRGIKGKRVILYVIRHGEAEGNREGRFLGQIDPPLTETGRQQARRMAGFLSGLGIRQILASDLSRAAETAGIVGAAIGLPVRRIPALREVNHGVIDGWTAAAIRASVYGREREKDKYNYRPPRGESYRDIEARILSVVAALAEEPSLIVTHMGPMRVLLHRLCGYDERRATATQIGHEQVLRLTGAGAQWSGDLIAGSKLHRL
jgi:broad specificity phosphatase PhoE